MNLDLDKIKKDDCEVSIIEASLPFSLPVVSSSSSSTKFQSSPSSSVSSISAENVYSLSDMFPLLSEAAVRSALCECSGDLSPAIDLLLTRDLMERERQEEAMNSDQTAPLCDLWVSGDCAGARAAACTARHFYLDSDSGGHGCRGKTKSAPAPDMSSKKVKRVRRQFSSPYRARLVKEQIRVEREEINIESGIKSSWIEFKERELVDLTG